MYEELFNTKSVAKIFEIPVRRLSQKLWGGDCHTPVKDASGRYKWTRRDIELCAWSLGRQRQFAAWAEQNPELTPPQPEPKRSASTILAGANRDRSTA